MLDELRREGRIVAVRPTPIAPELLVTVEDAPLYMSAYAEASCADKFDAPASDLDASRDEIVRRAFKTSAPVTPQEMAQRLRLTDSEITGALTRLEASGAIFRGHFTSGSALQWCDRYVLQRIHRETLAALQSITTVDVLPEAGIFGNGHTMALEKNNKQIMYRMIAWLEGNVFKPK